MASPPAVLAAGVVPVAPGDEPRFLVLRAYRYWDFPKGEVEPDEDPFAAARREVVEETGLAIETFPWGEVYHETEPYGRGKVARYYVGTLTEQPVTLPVSPELGRPEHHEARWVGFAEAEALLNERVLGALRFAMELISNRA